MPERCAEYLPRGTQRIVWRLLRLWRYRVALRTAAVPDNTFQFWNRDLLSLIRSDVTSGIAGCTRGRRFRHAIIVTRNKASGNGYDLAHLGVLPLTNPPV